MGFESSLTPAALGTYLASQLHHFFPDGDDPTPGDLADEISISMDRIYRCFSPVKTAYYSSDGKTSFHHLNGDHYATFLYFMANTLYHKGRIPWATKVFLLNKALHGLDAFYSVELPDHFLLVHPLGTVLGKASYGDFLVFYQNVTIGATHEGVYPTIEGKTIFYSRSSLIGRCQIGAEVVMASNSALINTDVPPSSTVVGSYPKHRILANKSYILGSIYEH